MLLVTTHQFKEAIMSTIQKTITSESVAARLVRRGVAK